MTNLELETQLHSLVEIERKTTKDILFLIREAEERRLPLEKGYKSTHKWLVKEYQYSGSSANRRIQASRLLKFLPRLEEKLEKGEVNLTTLTKMQSTIYREEKRTGKKMKAEEKKAILEKIEGKEEDAVENVLYTLFPEVVKKESLRQVNEEEMRLSICLTKEAIEILKQIRDLLSHTIPNASWEEVITHIAKKFLHAAAVSPRNKRCEYINPITKNSCESTYQVEVDHILPKALGGTNHPSNLRYLCKQHNLLEAEKKLGNAFMSKYRR